MDEVKQGRVKSALVEGRTVRWQSVDERKYVTYSPGTLVVLGVLFGVQLVVGGIFRLVGAITFDEGSGSARALAAILGVFSLLVGLYALRHIVITVLALGQKLLPAKAAVDVPLAVAIVGLGVLIVLAPASVPGLMPPM